jgi:outer membrane lipoprotein-sorting protein
MELHTVAAMVLAGAVGVFAITADEILDKMEANENASTARMEMTQVVYDAAGTPTESKLISYSFGKGEKGLMEYLEPARVKGMKILTLNDGDDVWFYSPRTARVRKIASNQKKQSVNNSDFSYEDLSTKDRREEYVVTLAGEEEKAGRPCYKLDLKAKDAGKTYSRITFWVDKERFVGLAGDMFDEEGKLWKKLRMNGVEKIGSYWTPKSIVMENVQKGSKTTMEMSTIEYDIDLDEGMFSERNLMR